MARFILAYHSTTGNTKAMADAISEGARSLELEPELVDAFDVRIEDLEEADAIGFGVPTFMYGPAKPVLSLVNQLRSRADGRKIAVVFGSYGWSGQGPIVIARLLRERGFHVLDPVIRVRYGPTENELFGCSLLGKEVARQLKGHRPTLSLEA